MPFDNPPEVNEELLRLADHIERSKKSFDMRKWEFCICGHATDMYGLDSRNFIQRCRGAPNNYARRNYLEVGANLGLDRYNSEVLFGSTHLNREQAVEKLRAMAVRSKEYAV